MIKKFTFAVFLLFSFTLHGHCAAAKTNALIPAGTAGVYWGAFVADSPAPLTIKQFEDNSGKKISQIMWFLDWNSDFPVAYCSVLYKTGYIPHITWEPWLWSDKTAINLDKIIAGQFDSYIESFAKGAKAYGNTLFLRVGHEFNGNWYPWAISTNKNDPEKYRNAYIHIHDIFTAVGADNVQWIWAPNNASVPDTAWNEPMPAYPGDKYVDWVGIDGYNFGASQSWSRWSSFSDIFESMYTKLSAAIKGKPFMISEFACSDKGGDKSAWALDLETGLKRFPLVKAVIWFNTNKETDWRIESSPETLNAFKKALASPFFLVSQKGLEGAAKNTSALIAAAENAPKIAASPVKIKPDDKKPLMLVKTVQDAVIDGVFSEKIKTPPLLIGANNSKSGNNVSGRIYIGYDSNSIYIFADIKDLTPGLNTKKGADIWNGDALEITLSTDPAAPADRTKYGDYDFQIGIKASQDTETWNFTKQAPLEKPIVFYNEKKDGYTIEAFIPWYNFNTGCFCRIKNKVIAFDAAIDNADGNIGRSSQVRWFGSEDYYKNPSQWGQIIFSTEP